MNSPSEYKIEFGPIAKTLLYEDAHGSVRFIFDTEVVSGQRVFFLERPANSLIASEQLRIDSAFERIKEYLTLRGHKVEVIAE